MAFNSANLTLIPAFNVISLIDINHKPEGFAYKYTTTDNISDVTTDGYFANAMLNPIRGGDYIGVEANDGKVLYAVSFITANTGSPDVTIQKIVDVSTFTSGIWS